MDFVFKIVIACFIYILLSCQNEATNLVTANSKNPSVNYDEKLVNTYELPPLLQDKTGATIKTVQAWQDRRQEILRDYETYVYGKIPAYNSKIDVKPIKKVAIWDGLAILEELQLTTSNDIDISLLVIKPNKEGKFPALLGLNFGGNQTISDNENISIFEGWVDAKIIEKPEFMGAVVNNRGTEASRDARGGYRWDIKQIVKNDIVFVSACYNDIAPDQPNLYSNVLKDHFADIDAKHTSAISIWAWGNSRIMDYILTREDVLKEKVVLYGHSRLGKTALWTMANDTRFAAIISNQSGEGGAALLRRNYGETIEIINNQFPHWFVGRFKEFNGKASSLPIDQHMLIAMVAPRPIYVASAKDDQWSDPLGEYLSQYYASDVYKLLTNETFKAKDKTLIEVDTAISGLQSYHYRSGPHSTNKFDWNHYVKFINKYVK